MLVRNPVRVEDTMPIEKGHGNASTSTLKRKRQEDAAETSKSTQAPVEPGTSTFRGGMACRLLPLEKEKTQEDEDDKTLFIDKLANENPMQEAFSLTPENKKSSAQEGGPDDGTRMHTVQVSASSLSKKNAHMQIL